MPTTRRNFLITTSAAAAAAASAPLSAAAYRNVIGANERVRMGLIGPGGMGCGHIGSFCKLRADGKVDVDIVAVCDVCKTHLDRGLQMARDGQEGVQVDGYRYYDELLARADIDAVLIAVPEHQHAAVAIAAVEAGKDVYLEKPMTLRLNEALALYDIVMAQDDIVFQVGTQKMALNKYREARRLIQEGAIGKPVWSQTSYCRNTPDGEWNYYGIDPKVVPGEMLDWKAWLGPLLYDPKRPGRVREFDTKIFHRWRRYKDFSTGIVGDLLVHEMTPLFFALDLGWPSRVDAIGGHYIDKEMENHDQVNLTIQFPEEHTMIVAGSTVNEQGLATTIRGQEGTIYLAGNNCEVRPERPFADDHEPQVVECERIADQDYLRMNWIESIKERKKPFSTVDIGAKVMVAVDLATRSMWEGKAFGFDAATRQVHAL
ncbi:MAG: gfo/Idh/MocA family oxidoreductase [Planctomycetota bacterium]|nr:MAG: gfo/Idh/MocA family oxidoreductase [Planctomycetota bacterium]